MKPNEAETVKAPGTDREVGPTERLAFNLREACAAIGVSPVSMWRMEKRGLIKPSKALRTKLYSRAEILRFLEDTK